MVTLEKFWPPKVFPKALHQLRSLLSSGHEEEGTFFRKKGGTGHLFTEKKCRPTTRGPDEVLISKYEVRYIDFQGDWSDGWMKNL